MRTGRPVTKEATTLGQRISAARRDAGLTQQQLADKLGVTQRVITYWERESVGLKAEQMTALAEALGVSLDRLMGREPAARRGGLTGRTRSVFERLTGLPRTQQAKIVEVVEALIAQSKANGKATS